MKQFRVDIIRNRDKAVLWSDIVPAEWEMEAEQRVSDEFWDSEINDDEAFYAEATEIEE